MSSSSARPSGFQLGQAGLSSDFARPSKTDQARTSPRPFQSVRSNGSRKFFLTQAGMHQPMLCSVLASTGEHTRKKSMSCPPFASSLLQRSGFGGRYFAKIGPDWAMIQRNKSEPQIWEKINSNFCFLRRLESIQNEISSYSAYTPIPHNFTENNHW